MTACDDHVTDVLHQFQAFVGVGVIADNIPQANHRLSLRPHIRQHRFEGLKIGVYIRNDRVLHVHSSPLESLPDPLPSPSGVGERGALWLGSPSGSCGATSTVRYSVTCT